MQQHRCEKYERCTWKFKLIGFCCFCLLQCRLADWLGCCGLLSERECAVPYKFRWKKRKYYAYISLVSRSKCILLFVLWSTGKGICRRLYLSSFLLSIRNIFAWISIAYFCTARHRCFCLLCARSRCTVCRSFSVFDGLQCWFSLHTLSYSLSLSLSLRCDQMQNRYRKHPHFTRLQNNKTVKCNYTKPIHVFHSLLWGHTGVVCVFSAH